MARGGNEGCGCLLIMLLLIWASGGVLQAFGVVTAGWLLYLIFIGVSIGIIIFVAKIISGD